LEADIYGEKRVYKDGGIRENNPSAAAWNEFVSMGGEYGDPGLLLSVGTGTFISISFSYPLIFASDWHRLWRGT